MLTFTPTYRWTGRRLAHFWTVDGSAIGKWHTASCSGKDREANVLKFYYKADRVTVMTHSLEISDYGLTGYWVIIEQERA